MNKSFYCSTLLLHCNSVYFSDLPSAVVISRLYKFYNSPCWISRWHNSKHISKLEIYAIQSNQDITRSETTSPRHWNTIICGPATQDDVVVYDGISHSWFLLTAIKVKLTIRETTPIMRQFNGITSSMIIISVPYSHNVGRPYSYYLMYCTSSAPRRLSLIISIVNKLLLNTLQELSWRYITNI